MEQSDPHGRHQGAVKSIKGKPIFHITRKASSADRDFHVGRPQSPIFECTWSCRVIHARTVLSYGRTAAASALTDLIVQTVGARRKKWPIGGRHFGSFWPSSTVLRRAATVALGVIVLQNLNVFAEGGRPGVFAWHFFRSPDEGAAAATRRHHLLTHQLRRTSRRRDWRRTAEELDQTPQVLRGCGQ